MPDTNLVLIRNQAPGTTVFTDGETGTSYEWQGAGDAFGADVQYVSPKLMENPHFRRALDRRVIVIEQASPEIMDAYNRQHEQAARLAKAQQQAVLERVDSQAGEDIVGLPCIAPGTQPGVPCGLNTMMREKDRKNKPPLCEMHSHLARDYSPAPSPTEVDDRGNPVTIWVKASFGAPLPSQADI
jgi:hypothetical protein